MKSKAASRPRQCAHRPAFAKPGKLLIDNRWVEAAGGNKRFPSARPGHRRGDCPGGRGRRAGHSPGRPQAARKAFDSGPWPATTPSQRVASIFGSWRTCWNSTRKNSQPRILDNGKPLAVARVADVPLAVDLLRYMAGWTTKIEGNTIPISVPYTPGASYLAFTLREPVGVVGQMIPWNFPLLMAAWKIGPALALAAPLCSSPPNKLLSPPSAGRVARKRASPRAWSIS